ncbi:alpha/beta hydrolase [Gallaecimonas xiamenensis]|uniref:Putative lysophospholipase, alpha/beta hydrolase superfamily protein n=1 Tax=Gallaecimonas xiamenensis 3-C-1 TaxID=745411 RepID=K2J3F3_9GAMM|nr:alpha/beta fold hydrolase [Gallaecimonas xiamenensis]EKE77541.1 putative lysophospholipase, alpha/beta hydrolase superfamily protein [Gallaecimonas xiamenensis 3-C-1]
MKWPLLLLAVLLSGCASYVTELSTQPERQRPSFGDIPASLLGLQVHNHCPAPCIAFMDGQPWAAMDKSPDSFTLTYSLDIEHRATEIRATQSALSGTVILLPGFSSSYMTMMPWSIYFQSRGFHTLLPDLPAQGYTSIEDFSFGVRDADYLAPWFSKHQMPRPWLVVGHSMGAIAATYLAERIHADALVLMTPSSPFKEASQSASAAFSPLLSKLIPQGSLNAGLDDALTKMQISEHQTDLRPLLASWQDPLLLLAAKHDGVIRDDWAPQLKAPALTRWQGNQESHLSILSPSNDMQQLLDQWLATSLHQPMPVPLSPSNAPSP